MPVKAIVEMALRAAGFGAAAGVCWLLFRGIWLWWERRPFRWRRERLLLLLACYLAGLLEITVLRGAFRLPQPGILLRVGEVQWIPLYTFRELEKGLWAFVYPVAGNILWFLPLGILLPLCRKRTGPGRVAAVSASVSTAIELLQLLFASGVTDLDDLIFNVLGGLLGYGLFWLGRRLAGR